MKKIFGSPSRYVQGMGVLKELSKYTNTLGKKPAIVVDPDIAEDMLKIVSESYSGDETKYYVEILGKNSPRICCEETFNLLRKNATKAECDMYVGIGGGTTLDVAKAAAHFEKAPMISCPTIAATDAPCSALSVVYHPNGVWDYHLFLDKNPNYVLVDEDVIVHAPLRYNLAGIPDALSTYYEAATANAANVDNFLGGKHTVISETIAQLCYDTIYAYGEQAASAFKVHAVTPAVEKVIEASTLLSGVGFESNQSAASHAIQNAMTAIPSSHDFFHGEKVTFGILGQLALEAWDDEEIDKYCKLCIHLGLPVTLAELGMDNLTDDEIMEMAKLACQEGETIHNTVVLVTPRVVFDAIKTADELGKQYKEKYSKII
ncbi:MAG: glycerol dehydrogenase [Anaerostipes sp.]|nr:glycerol dehydrogenase [Anaerostipes sp.]